MLTFVYKAKDNSGKDIKGEIEALNENQAIQIIKENKLYPYFVKEKKKESIKLVLKKIKRKVSSRELNTFTRQLSTMINAGLSIPEALKILKTSKNPYFSEIIEKILKEVNEGKSLSEALENFPNVFKKVYISLVKAGEVGGTLDIVLNKMANNLESQEEFKGKVKGAMIYPIIIIIGMLVVGIIMMVAVIPKMLSLYKDIGADLPASTKLLINITDLFTKWWWITPILLLTLGITIKFLLSSPQHREKIELLRLKLPILGPLSIQTTFAELTNTLSLLISTGVPLLEALQVSAQIPSNTLIQKEIKEIENKVKKGNSLSQAISECKYFPSLISEMTAVGEETGKLDEVLSKISNFYQRESEESIKNLTTAIEPLIMIVLGIGVGFLVISVLMPMYNLTSQIK